MLGGVEISLPVGRSVHTLRQSDRQSDEIKHFWFFRPSVRAVERSVYTIRSLDRPVGQTSRTDRSVRRSYRVNAQLGNSIVICRAFNPLSSYKILLRCLCSLLITIIYKRIVTSSSRRHFIRCYLKVNKASKSEGIRKLYWRNCFENVLILLASIIKISSCSSKLHLAKFAAFLWHSVQQCAVFQWWAVVSLHTSS